MEYTQALEWLHSLGRLTEKPGPQRMEALLAALGNPQRRLRFVHVAGTNGKGSTVVMTASILKEAGYTVGASISPYVLDFCERFQINGENASQQKVAEALTRVRLAVESIGEPTIEFMAVTAAALYLFEREGCDIVCLEAGIGGSHDDTNIIENTEVACIMKVGLDHTELLGDTVDRIALEKCGIFKNHCDVISYPQQPKPAETVIRQQAAKQQCRLTVPSLQDFHFYISPPFVNRCNYGGYELTIPFPGVHQCLNASVAVEAALALWNRGYTIEDEHIVAGIAKARLTARIEVLQRQPLVILDGAHNLDSAEALANTLRAERIRGLTAVMGVLRDKQATDMLRILSPYIERIYTVQPNSPRAYTAGELMELAKPYVNRVVAIQTVEEAVEKALKEQENGVLICGSLYLAGTARAFFGGS